MSTESTEFAHSMLITLSVVVIILLLINTFLLISRNKKDDEEESLEKWDNNLNNMWDNGGVYNGYGLGANNNEFDVKIACSCSGYGVKRPNSDNMPYNNDSNLYNSPAQLYKLPPQQQS